MNLLPYFPLILIYILEFDTTSLIPDVLLYWMHSIWIFFLVYLVFSGYWSLFAPFVEFHLAGILCTCTQAAWLLWYSWRTLHFPRRIFYIDDYRNASIMSLRERLCCVFPEWEPLKIKAKCKLYQQNMYVHQWCRFCSCCILSYS